MVCALCKYERGDGCEWWTSVAMSGLRHRERSSMRKCLWHRSGSQNPDVDMKQIKLRKGIYSSPLACVQHVDDLCVVHGVPFGVSLEQLGELCSRV